MKIRQVVSFLALGTTVLAGPPSFVLPVVAPERGGQAAPAPAPAKPAPPVQDGHTSIPAPVKPTATSVKPSSSSTTSSTTTSTSSTTTGLTPGCTNGPSSRSCWGAYNIDTDYGTTWPNTGVTKSYTFHITNTTLSPDGTPKQVLAVNGQIPGPTIEANWGDMISVQVFNDMQTNGTSLHWHGLRQLHSNDQDGTNGVTECALAPGDSKTYTFQATEYGTSWYHSHFSAQYGDGVQGPIVINGPTSANYDVDLGTVMVSDLYPLTVFQEAYFAERTGDPTASNYLLNGMNAKPDGSSGTRFTETFTAGKKYLLRLINTSVENFMTVALDGHTMTVIAADFVPITPYTAASVKINIGQRYDVIIEANQPVSSYWLRAMVGPCSKNANNGLGSIANGVIAYSGASTGLPTSKPATFTNVCADEPAASLVPIVSTTIDSSTFASQVSALPAGPSLTNANSTVFRWTLDGVSEVVDWADPTLLDISSGQNNQTKSANIITLPNANSWVFFVVESQMPMQHPFHIHGHDFFVLGVGEGTYTSSDYGSLNFNNPVRRDVATLPASGYLVVAFKTDNPGAWLLHCHIAWHVSEGLSMQFLEVPSAIPGLYPVTSAMVNTCTNWKKYMAAGPVYVQSDSGLRRRGHLARHAHKQGLGSAF